MSLFVIYIPCDEEDLVESKPENDTQSTENTEEKTVSAEAIDAKTDIPQIEVSENVPYEDREQSKADNISKRKDSGFRSVQTTPVMEPMVDADQQEESKPLLLSDKKTMSDSTDPMLSESQKNLETKDYTNSLSSSKFKVSKAKEATGTDSLLPGTDSVRRPSQHELKEMITDEEHIHDVTTEIFTLEEALFKVLSDLEIENDVWEKNYDKNQWQITFLIDSHKRDQVLNRLTGMGLGHIAGTSVSVFPTVFHYFGQRDGSADSVEISQEKEEKNRMNEFISSIKSRLTVVQVVGEVKSNASLTFDFLVLILLASMIAGLGLAESSSVVLVASMLISPLMGPILGFTFGVEVQNPELWKLGVTNEIIGLSICLAYGFLFGLFTGCINNTAARWGSSSSWPTVEMQARGMLRSLWVGVLIALPSGAGVALSILGGNTGSLVGVAISASLLPPAVNAGMLWGLALVSAISHPPLVAIDNSTHFSNVPPDCHPLNNNDYEFYYSCDMPVEAAILASVSLLLTVLNIICIFIMGIAVLKVKEFAPDRSMPQATARFWKRDLAFARGTYKTIKGRDTGRIARDLLALYKDSNPNGRVDTIAEEIQRDPTLYEGPAEIPAKMPEFLRQLSLEGHQMARRNQGLATETVKIGDRLYQTVTNNAVAGQLLRSSEEFRNVILKSSDLETRHKKGSVLRFRMSTPGTSPETLMPTIGEAREDGQLLMIDVQHLQPSQKVGRKDRLSAKFSSESHTTPTVGRFKVKTIKEMPC